MKAQKTNAMRELDKLEVEYEVKEFEPGGDDPESSAPFIASSKGEARVYKTLVTASDKEHLVFVVPLDGRLDLKKAAAAAGVKRVEMIPMKELKNVTGYVHGGCSPLAMKKKFRTFIDESVILSELVAVSGGKVGVRMILPPDDLARAAEAQVVDIAHDD